MKIFVGVLFLLFSVRGPAWSAKSALVLPLLDRSATANAAGEGGAFLSGLDAVGVNPAGLAGAPREWNANYRQPPLETSVGGIAFCIPFQRRSAPLPTAPFSNAEPTGPTFGASYTSYQSKGFERRGADGSLGGEFRQEDQMLGLHLAAPFLWGGHPLAAGVSLKGMQSRVEAYSGKGVAVDLGLRHSPRAWPLAVSLTALNLGQGPRLLRERSALPTSYGASAAWNFFGSGVLFGGATYQPHQESFSTSWGAQYTVKRILAIRGHYSTGTERGGRRGMGPWICGFDLSLGKARFAYAFQPTGEDLSETGTRSTQQATLSFIF